MGPSPPLAAFERGLNTADEVLVVSMMMSTSQHSRQSVKGGCGHDSGGVVRASYYTIELQDSSCPRSVRPQQHVPVVGNASREAEEATRSGESMFDA